MTANNWFTKDRSETASNRMPDRRIGSIEVLNPALGINVYRGAISPEDCSKYIQTLETQLSGSSEYQWSNARVVNSSDADAYARNAQDFKVSSNNLGPRTEKNSALYDVHEELFQRLRTCMSDYGYYWGVGIQSYEAFNFVKYDGPGTQFRVHADHGPTYVATISAVLYLNDDYEGGELFFPRFGVDLKPKTGDIAIFPSTFIYEHASKEMISGIKYAVVVMTDYNDRDGVNQKVSPVVEDYKLKY
jgi:hypothetical protein